MSLVPILVKRTQYRTTPLHTAVNANMKNVVELLIKECADINAKDNWGRTSLNFAIVSGGEGIVKLLVAVGGSASLPPNRCRRNKIRNASP